MNEMNAFSRRIDREDIKRLQKLSRLCRGDIIKMTTLAGSGHPAGSMSSIDIYLTVFSFANVTPENLDAPNRDRVIVSHGHTSPGVYAALARLGFTDTNDVLTGFRQSGSLFEGHIERHVPGVEWSTGNLGQGLSAACGFALASKLGSSAFDTFCLMSDAEQAKGQVSEARRFARKYALNNLTVVIDYNHFQISGRTDDIMPVNIKEGYRADGWRVIDVPGHDFRKLFTAIRRAVRDRHNPYAIIAHTTMGHGVSFMENKADYHGKALSREECTEALRELGLGDDLDELLKTKGTRLKTTVSKPMPVPAIKTGKPSIYIETMHPRAAFGNALADIARMNDKNTIAVFDCDLRDSVKTSKFAQLLPANFFQAGVSEHNVATIAGALSINGIVALWADFGVFAVDEVYNQLRLNDVNTTNVKIVATHLGYNVGPDGKTHHCIDYMGLLRNLFGFKLIVPGDPNQTDHLTRYLLSEPGNMVMGLTRSKLPVIKSENGDVFYTENYEFTYGKIDLIREGEDCVIFTSGGMLYHALDTWNMLKDKGITARVYNVSCPLDIDSEIVVDAAETGLIVSYEDHVVTTGLGCTVAQIIAENRVAVDFLRMGVRQFGDSADADLLYKKYGLDAHSLATTIVKHLQSKKASFTVQP
jgi:transketolase